MFQWLNQVLSQNLSYKTEHQNNPLSHWYPMVSLCWYPHFCQKKNNPSTAACSLSRCFMTSNSPKACNHWLETSKALGVERILRWNTWANRNIWRLGFRGIGRHEQELNWSGNPGIQLAMWRNHWRTQHIGSGKACSERPNPQSLQPSDVCNTFTIL